MIEIKYDNNIDEIKRGFIKIHNRYALKRIALFSIVFLIAAILGIDMIIKNPQGYPGYIITSLAFGMGAAQWLRPFMVRSRMIKTIEKLNEEKYTACFHDDRIEIETDIIENENETEVVYITSDGVGTVANPDILESPQVAEAVKKADKTVINIGTEELRSGEDDIIFCLFVNRSLVYIFPKRCMDRETEAALREYFSDKAI